MKLINDKYRKKRGGYSRLFNINCQECGSSICLYQKDGPGIIKRMYIDRMGESNVSLLRKDLSCAKGHLLGVKILYEKEKRPAFRLFAGSVTKKIVKGK